MMKQYHKIVILLLLLTCITMSASAEVSEDWQRDCAASGGWFTVVYSNPDAGPNEVTTPPLDNGRMFTIYAGEYFWYNYPDNLKADAQCYQEVEDGAFIPAPDGHSFLQLGTGEPQDVSWGPCSNSNGYEYDLVGTGEALNIRIKDWMDDNLDNNNCHLPVCIVPEPSIPAPEFPTLALPGAMVIGFLGVVLFILRTKEQ
jgi:hypothetical protein